MSHASPATDPRDDVPEYPRYEFPQTGWHRIECFAAAFGQSRRQFLDNLNIHSVPKLRFGTQILVNAELFIECLKERNRDDFQKR